MAGALSETTTLALTGLGPTVTWGGTAKTLTVPVEWEGSRFVLATATTTAYQLFDMTARLALAKIFAVYLKCEVGTLYILVDTAGTATFAAAAADLVLNAGEDCWLPINPAGNLGLCLDGSAITVECTWAAFAQT